MKLSHQSITRGVTEAIKERIDSIVKDEVEKATAIVRRRIQEVVSEMAVNVSMIDEFNTMSTRLNITLQIGDTKVNL